MFRPQFAVIAAVAVVALAGCKSTTSSSPSVTPTTSTGQTELRVVHGSPDAGPVDIFVDSSSAATAVTYGTVSGFNNVTSGTHTITIYPAGNDVSTAAIATLAVNFAQGTKYSAVATGEINPRNGSKNIAVTLFTDTPFSTTTGSAAINFHHAAPVAASVEQIVPFGFAPLNNIGDNGITSMSFGNESGPQGLPQAALTTAGVEFYGITSGTGGFTILPSKIDPSDTGNLIPFGTNDVNLSLFAIDGPAASLTPSSSISGTDLVRFVGAFDANG